VCGRPIGPVDPDPNLRGLKDLEGRWFAPSTETSVMSMISTLTIGRVIRYLVVETGTWASSRKVLRPTASENGRFFEVSKVRIGDDGHVSDVLTSATCFGANWTQHRIGPLAPA
jgi:hypothetical protein